MTKDIVAESLVGDSRGRCVHLIHDPKKESVIITTNYVSPLNESLVKADIKHTVKEGDGGTLTYVVPASAFEKVRESMKFFPDPVDHEALMSAVYAFGSRLKQNLSAGLRK